MPAPQHILAVLLLLLTAGCASPYVYQAPPRPAVPVLTAGHAVMDDGYRLPLLRREARGGARAVLLGVHGMNDYSRTFARLGDYLSARGITLVAYDQRGFGATEGAGLWHGGKRMEEDLHLMVRLLREQYPGRPLYLLGHSLGAAVVVAAQGRRPLPVDGIILAAPAILDRRFMPFYQRGVLSVLAHLVPALRLDGSRLHMRASDNDAVLMALHDDPLVIKGTRIDAIYGMTRLIHAASQSLAALRGPVLLMHGARDEIVPPGVFCRLLQDLPDEPDLSWQALVYAEGYHLLLRDLQAERVWADIERWVTAGGQGVRLAQPPLRLDGRRFCSHRDGAGRLVTSQ